MFFILPFALYALEHIFIKNMPAYSFLSNPNFTLSVGPQLRENKKPAGRRVFARI